MTQRPTEIKLSGDQHLQIDWDDGQKFRLKFFDIREQCPCATCREKRAAEEVATNELPILSLADTEPIKIAGMKPVGNYAYSIEFSDGHSNGIFTLEFLRFLCDKMGDKLRDD